MTNSNPTIVTKLHSSTNVFVTKYLAQKKFCISKLAAVMDCSKTRRGWQGKRSDQMIQNLLICCLTPPTENLILCKCKVFLNALRPNIWSTNIESKLLKSYHISWIIIFFSPSSRMAVRNSSNRMKMACFICYVSALYCINITIIIVVSYRYLATMYWFSGVSE